MGFRISSTHGLNATRELNGLREGVPESKFSRKLYGFRRAWMKQTCHLARLRCFMTLVRLCCVHGSGPPNRPGHLGRPKRFKRLNCSEGRGGRGRAEPAAAAKILPGGLSRWPIPCCTVAYGCRTIDYNQLRAYCMVPQHAGPENPIFRIPGKP